MGETVQTQQPTYKQTFRRHRILLSIPMVIGLIAAAYFALGKTPTYQSSTTLWIDTAPPTASSVSSAGYAGTPPASAEQQLLQELLSTNTFAVAVARNSLLSKYVATPLSTYAAPVLESGVTSFPTGAQVLRITFSSPNAALSRSVVGAIVKQLQQDASGLTAQHDAAALSYDRQQVGAAASALTQARQAVTGYTSQHPSANLTLDPTLASLVAAEDAANNQYTTANTTLQQASAAHSGGGWMVELVDPPTTPTAAPQSKKKMIEVLLAGLLGGGLVSLLGTMALTPGRKEPWEDEVGDPRLTAEGLVNRPFESRFAPSMSGASGDYSINGDRGFHSPLDPDGDFVRATSDSFDS